MVDHVNGLGHVQRAGDVRVSVLSAEQGGVRDELRDSLLEPAPPCAAAVGNVGPVGRCRVGAGRLRHHEGRTHAAHKPQERLATHAAARCTLLHAARTGTQARTHARTPPRTHACPVPDPVSGLQCGRLLAWTAFFSSANVATTASKENCWRRASAQAATRGTEHEHDDMASNGSTKPRN